jgi:hypothetical protein
VKFLLKKSTAAVALAATALATSVLAGGNVHAAVRNPETRIHAFMVMASSDTRKDKPPIKPPDNRPRPRPPVPPRPAPRPPVLPHPPVIR